MSASICDRVEENVRQIPNFLKQTRTYAAVATFLNRRSRKKFIAHILNAHVIRFVVTREIQLLYSISWMHLSKVAPIDFQLKEFLILAKRFLLPPFYRELRFSWKEKKVLICKDGW